MLCSVTFLTLVFILPVTESGAIRDYLDFLYPGAEGFMATQRQDSNQGEFHSKAGALNKCTPEQ